MELLRTGQLPEPLSVIPGVHPMGSGHRESPRSRAAERIGARKRTIQIALEAAVHRDKLAAVLKCATIESSGAIVIPGEATSRREPHAHTDITRRGVVTSVDEYATTRVVNDAVANGSSGRRHAPLDSATIEPPRERLPVRQRSARQRYDRPTRERLQVRRIWLALVLVLGIGSILGTLIFGRTSAPAPPPIETAILPPRVQAVSGELTVRTNDAPSAAPPAPSSTESTRKGVVPLPGTLRPRLSPRSAATSPRPVTGDVDGI
jgi:hypothetical protein